MKNLIHNVLQIFDHNTEIRVWSKDGTPKSMYSPFVTKLRRALGLDVYVLKTHNLITNVGHAAANGRMSNQGGYSPFTNIAIGIGTTAVAVTDTALQSEITTNGGARGAATTTQVTTSVTNDTTQLVKTFTFTGSFAVTEEGILDNAVSGGSLLARQVFSAINVVSGDQIQFTHKYQS